MLIKIILIYAAIYFSLFTAIFFLFTFIENKKNIKNPLPKRLPKVSVIVPAYNEEKTIEKTINSILKLNYPKDKLQIICVNDGSTDKTYKIAKKYENKGVLVLTKENGGKASALNLGLEYCTGEFVASLDADSFVMKNTLRKMIGYFEDPNVMAVTPSLKIWKPKTILQKIQMIEYLLGVFLRKTFSLLNSIHVTPGPFTLYRKKFFDKYGNYDVNNITEDIEVALRIQEHKYLIKNAMDAEVFTVGPSKFKPLARQRTRWYRGFTENVWNYKKLFSPKYGDLGVFVLPIAFISVAFCIIFFLYTIYIYSDKLIKILLNLASINFDFWPLLKMNFHLTPMVFLGIGSLVLGTTMVYIGKKFSNDRAKFKIPYLTYLIVYWPLFAIWWLMAGFNKIFNIKEDWHQHFKNDPKNQ